MLTFKGNTGLVGSTSAKGYNIISATQLIVALTEAGSGADDTTNESCPSITRFVLNRSQTRRKVNCIAWATLPCCTPFNTASEFLECATRKRRPKIDSR